MSWIGLKPDAVKMSFKRPRLAEAVAEVRLPPAPRYDRIMQAVRLNHSFQATRSREPILRFKAAKIVLQHPQSEADIALPEIRRRILVRMWAVEPSTAS
jgi:hypothetical protein